MQRKRFTTKTRLKSYMGMLKYRSSGFVENLFFPFREHYKKKEAVNDVRREAYLCGNRP